MKNLKRSLAAACLVFAAGLGITPPANAGQTPSVDESYSTIWSEPGTFPGLSVPNLYIHQFNAHNPDVHIGSVINAFEHGERPASAHFAVEADRVAEFGTLDDTMFAQGEGNYDGISVETYGPQDEATKQQVAQLIYELEVLKGSKFNLMTHSEVMQTACGEGVDLADYRARVDALHNPPPPPAPKTWRDTATGPATDVPKTMYMRAA